jgi:cysteine desulfurase / selenocysteine lyase
MNNDPYMLQQWRDDTPGCKSVIHLNNAGAALMPDCVYKEVVEHLHLESTMGGYEAAEMCTPKILETYRELGKLIHADAANIAVVENATVAVSQALSAFDFKPEDCIVTSRTDYVSNQLMYIALAKRTGVRILHCRNTEDGEIDLEELRQLVRKNRCKLVAITWIPTNTGIIQPVEEIGRICHEEGVYYLIDACQAIGQLPVNIADLNCDFLAATSRKFLRGPRGLGFLYCSPRVIENGLYPLYIDLHGATWTGENEFIIEPSARRFENWEFAYALVLGMGEAARYYNLHRKNIHNQLDSITNYTRKKLEQLPSIKMLDRGRRKSAIITLHAEHTPVEALKAKLEERKINVSTTYKKWALFDMTEKGVDSALRISPHYYNSEEEIDQLQDLLKTLLR